MAEGYLEYYAKGKIQVLSAGLESHGIHPMAIEVMAEDSIDISHQQSKTLKSISRNKFNYLITLCAGAKEALPSNFKVKKTLHFDVPDPAKFKGSEEEIKEEFRKTRESVKKYILKFIGKELSAKTTPFISVPGL